MSICRRNRAMYLAVMTRITGLLLKNHDGTRTQPRASIFVGSASRPSCRRGSLVSHDLPPPVLEMTLSRRLLRRQEGRRSVSGGHVGSGIKPVNGAFAPRDGVVIRGEAVVWGGVIVGEP